MTVYRCSMQRKREGKAPNKGTDFKSVPSVDSHGQNRGNLNYARRAHDCIHPRLKAGASASRRPWESAEGGTREQSAGGGEREGEAQGRGGIGGRVLKPHGPPHNMPATRAPTMEEATSAPVT